MPGHIVTSYDTDLENLRRSISEMGGVAEKMTAEATDALVRRDDTLAQAVILADKRLDALQRDIEERGRSFESVREQYNATVRPMHLMFVEPSKRWADVILPEGGENRAAVDLVVGKVESVLSGR